MISVYIIFPPTDDNLLQRGTGLSTPLTASSMLQFKSAEGLVDYLKHFRADNIVKDAEFIRVRLVPEAGPWTVLGQVKDHYFLSVSDLSVLRVLPSAGTSTYLQVLDQERRKIH